HTGAVAIIAITDDDKIIFVEQYRKPLERSLIEIPAGKLEPNEQAEITALRELEEETGYTTKKLDYITSIYTSPGFADEIMHIYYTNSITRVENPAELDDDEFVKVHYLTFDEAEQLILEHKIYDAKTVYALMYLKNKRMGK